MHLKQKLTREYLGEFGAGLQHSAQTGNATCTEHYAQWRNLPNDERRRDFILGIVDESADVLEMMREFSELMEERFKNVKGKKWN